MQLSAEGVESQVLHSSDLVVPSTSGRPTCQSEAPLLPAATSSPHTPFLCSLTDLTPYRSHAEGCCAQGTHQCPLSGMQAADFGIQVNAVTGFGCCTQGTQFRPMQAAKGQPAPGQPLPAKLAVKGTAPGPGPALASAGRLADSAHASWEPEDLHALVQTVQSLDALPPGQHARSGSSSGGHSICSASERTTSVAPRAGASPRQAGAAPFMHTCKADQA